MNSEPITYAQEWFARGEEDLVAIALFLKNESVPNIACFHAQQAAEKYLKGYLAQHERHIRKAHSLQFLLDACTKIDASFGALTADVAFLDELYFSSRYPDNYTEYQNKDAQEAYAAAERVKALVLDRLSGDASSAARGFGAFGFVLTAAAVILVAAGGYWLYTSTTNNTDGSGAQTACIEDIRYCPDGTTVGRTGPNCEFAECPSPEIIFGKKAEELCGPQPPAICQPGAALGCDIKNKKWDCYPEVKDGSDTSNWKTYRNEEYGFEFRYPSQWEAIEGLVHVHKYDLSSATNAIFIPIVRGTQYSPAYYSEVEFYVSTQLEKFRLDSDDFLGRSIVPKGTAAEYGNERMIGNTPWTEVDTYIGALEKGVAYKNLFITVNDLAYVFVMQYSLPVYPEGYQSNRERFAIMHAMASSLRFF